MTRPTYFGNITIFIILVELTQPERLDISEKGRDSLLKVTPKPLILGSWVDQLGLVSVI